MSPATDGPQHLRNRLSSFREPEIVRSVEPAAQRQPSHSWFSVRTAVYALLVLGAVLRLVPMIQNRCLWIDESMLALNLVERSPQQLLEPLDWNQGAPAGFLLAVKATILLFGESEWALRLFPFAASVMGMMVFAWLVRRLMPPAASIIAITLYAISPSLISYTAECKQYATDAVLTVAGLAIASGLLYRQGGARRWAVLGAFGAIALWFSHPVVFVLGSIGSALFLDALVMQDRRRIHACAATIGCWLASFGVCYVTMLRHLGSNNFLIDYWAGHFMALPPTSVSDAAWILGHLSGFIEFPGGLGGTEVKASGLAAAFFLIGVAGFLRDRWPVALSLVGPAVFALAASALHKYPFAGRLLLFLAPLLLIGVARGAWAVAAALRPTLPIAAIAMLGILLTAPAIETYQQLRRPPRVEQLTEVLADVRREWQDGDVVYLYYGGVPAYTFYSRESLLVPGRVVMGTEFHSQRTGYRDQLRALAGEQRVWLVFSHRHLAEESLLLAYAEGLGECKQTLRRPGANAFLFDFKGQ